ncbi:MAG TPA: class I SAM-dependent methyltransferase [Candidatus Nitrosopolaris sp.]|nr:class I SAM-dependent methyltransferase [Candidatus Nitrosopolaris sp.]
MRSWAETTEPRSITIDPRLLDTRHAFDSVADVYDGPRGNNALIQRMRHEVWRVLGDVFPAGARLLDLGCGTGIDAVHLAASGYEILATDWSPAMVARTCGRAAEAGVGDRIRAEVLGAHELQQLAGAEFDGIYSNLGPLNCALDLPDVARWCASALKPRGRMVVSVIGRVCPWEFVYYAVRRDLARARLRGLRDTVPVTLNRHTVWTSYYTPREFYRAFAREFELTRYGALALFLPPPYLIGIYERLGPLGTLLGWLDDRLGTLPLLRDAGDHFLMVMTRRTSTLSVPV